jgi:transmembrane sensor
MNYNIEWNLIIKSLENNLNLEEEKELKSWLDASLHNKSTFDHIQQIWKTADNPLPQPDLELGWQRIKNRIEIHSEKRQEQFDENSKLIWRKMLKSRIFQAAAVSLIGIISIYILLRIGLSVNMHEIKVENMQQKNIILSDGTRLFLDAGSLLKYPDNFNNENREVYLSGEGYFEVNPHPEHPFIVHTNSAVITVLGTEFNIRAWQEEKEVTLAVVEGTVTFKAKENHHPDAVVHLTENQVSVLKNDANPTHPVHMDITPYLSWRQHKIYFKSTPLRNVLDQVERWYDIEIQFPDKTSLTNLVTVFIDDKPLEDILDTIALMNGYTYHQEGKKVIFYTRQ